jgi:oligopeptide transport system ATP-binding protein
VAPRRASWTHGALLVQGVPIMTYLLEIKRLTTEFQTQDGMVHAVNGISLDLQEGETLAIVGESGCGKSVSMLSVLRLIPHPPGRIVNGEILFHGQNLLTMSEPQMRRIRGHRIAMIFQDPMTSLNPVLSIGQQIGEALELHLNMDRRQARRRSIELLEMVKIPSAAQRIDDYPHQFSGGMRQRVMIAMALSCKPQVLIADEPTTALDVTIQAQIIDLIKTLRDELGMAIIWITHDLGIVAGLADRVQIMYAGYIVERAEVRAFYRHPRHPYSRGLLASLPRLDTDTQATGHRQSDRRLTPIKGLPPDLIALPQGCPFQARCAHVIERCRQENPPLRDVGGAGRATAQVACWVDLDGRGEAT